MTGPFDYSLCDQTVTVYRKLGTQISRKVISGCYYRWWEQKKIDELGVRQEVKGVLIVPGNENIINMGDRVIPGEGPQLTSATYATLIPGSVSGVTEINYAAPCYWEGKICHTEYGRK